MKVGTCLVPLPYLNIINPENRQYYLAETLKGLNLNLQGGKTFALS